MLSRAVLQYANTTGSNNTAVGVYSLDTGANTAQGKFSLFQHNSKHCHWGTTR